MITFNNENGLYTGDQALRVTALLYLKEALVKERYEECPELIAAAKRFGATQRDIRANIAKGLRRLKLGGAAEVPRRKIGRRRF
jgi:hypothetical protein